MEIRDTVWDRWTIGSPRNSSTANTPHCLSAPLPIVPNTVWHPELLDFLAKFQGSWRWWKAKSFRGSWGLWPRLDTQGWRKSPVSRLLTDTCSGRGGHTWGHSTPQWSGPFGRDSWISAAGRAREGCPRVSRATGRCAHLRSWSVWLFTWRDIFVQGLIRFDELGSGISFFRFRCNFWQSHLHLSRYSYSTAPSIEVASGPLASVTQPHMSSGLPPLCPHTAVPVDIWVYA